MTEAILPGTAAGDGHCPPGKVVSARELEQRGVQGLGGGAGGGGPRQKGVPEAQCGRACGPTRPVIIARSRLSVRLRGNITNENRGSSLRQIKAQ